MYHIVDARTGRLASAIPRYRREEAEGTAQHMNSEYPEPIVEVVEGGWDVGTGPWARRWLQARRGAE